MTKEEIGKILKELRQNANMTQKEVALAIGRTQQIVGHWETGYSQPDADTLFTLCNLYGASVDEAFGYKKNSPAPAEAETGELAQDDLELLADYHKLNESGREAARNAVRGLTYAPNYQQLKERHSVEMADIADDAIRTIDKLTEMTRKNQNNSLRKK